MRSKPSQVQPSNNNCRQHRQLKNGNVSQQEKWTLYGLYKQATCGDAPKVRSSSFTFATPANIVKNRFWSKISNKVPDSELEQAFEHLEKALAIVQQSTTGNTNNNNTSTTTTSESSNINNNNCNNKNYDNNDDVAKPKSRLPFLYRAWNSKKDAGSNMRLLSNNHSIGRNYNPGAINSIVSPDEMLLLAAMEEDEVTLRKLLEQRTVENVDYRDEIGQTALHICADRGLVGCVQLLLDYGADIDAADLDGISVLQAAVISGHALVCRELLNRGANPDQPDQDGDTARLCAMDDGSEALRGLFAEHGNEDDVVDLKANYYGLLGPSHVDNGDSYDFGGEMDQGGDQDDSDVISWKTDFTGQNFQTLVDRVPSSFHKNH